MSAGIMYIGIDLESKDICCTEIAINDFWSPEAVIVPFSSVISIEVLNGF
ncbi:MAG: hypothetical protein ACO3UU_13825 [Minisyncoccia bacterium]